MPKIPPKIIFNNMMPIDTYENPKKSTDLTQPIASENVELQKCSFIAGETAKKIQPF